MSFFLSFTKSAFLVTILCLILVFIGTPFMNFVDASLTGYVEYAPDENIYDDNYSDMKQSNAYSEGKRLLNAVLDSSYVLADSMGFTSFHTNKQHGSQLDIPYYTYLANDMSDCNYNLDLFRVYTDDFKMWKTESHQDKLHYYVENVALNCLSVDDIMYSGAFSYEELGTSFDEWQALPEIRKWILLYNAPDFDTFHAQCHGKLTPTDFDEGSLKNIVYDYIMGWFD